MKIGPPVLEKKIFEGFLPYMCVSEKSICYKCLLVYSFETMHRNRDKTFFPISLNNTQKRVFWVSSKLVKGKE